MIASSTTRRRPKRGTPINIMGDTQLKRQRQEDKENGLLRPAHESFLPQMMHHTPLEYIQAYNENDTSTHKSRLLWQKLCQVLMIKAPTHKLPGVSFSVKEHFNERAAMVVEESIYALSAALASRWVDHGRNRNRNSSSNTPTKLRKTPREIVQNRSANDVLKHKSSCEPMKMILVKRDAQLLSACIKFDFELPPGEHFNPRQRFHLRAGTVVECLPDNNHHNGLDSVVLGVIVDTNSRAASAAGKFTVAAAPRDHTTHMECSKWSVQPITSFVAEMRQLETCLLIRRGDVKPPFINLITGQKQFIQEMQKEKEQTKMALSPSPTSVVAGSSTGEHPHSYPHPTTVFSPDWRVAGKGNSKRRALNETQIEAAIDFIQSKPGTISLVQGPPGTGKTTFLVATLCQLMKNMVHRQKLQDNVPGLNTSTHPIPKTVLVAAPSNKAISVLADRFLTAISATEGGQDVRIVLVGDDEKLLEDTFADSTDSTSSNSSRDILPANLLFNLDNALNALETALRQRPTEARLEGTQYRLLVQFIDIGDLFRAGVKTRAEKLRKILVKKNRKRQSIKALMELVEHVRQDVSFSIGKKGMRFKMMCALVRRADIIFCTLATSGCNIFKPREQQPAVRIGDLIVDEAAAATESEVAIPFHLKPERCLFVGDPNQLPATVFSPRARQFGHDRSLHQRLMSSCHFPFTMLDKQYRMKPEISKFPSQQFYDGRLGNGAQVTRPSYRSPCPLLEDLQGPFLFQQINGREEQKENGSWENREEAKAVLEWIRKLEANAGPGDPNWCRSGRVRIITFYQAQVNLINSMLGRGGFDLVATTVDSSQGCEADLVIVSFVRTCNRQTGGGKRIAGFLTDDRRLNVALTRARYELICIGDAENMLANREVVSLQALASTAKSRGCLESGTTRSSSTAENSNRATHTAVPSRRPPPTRAAAPRRPPSTTAAPQRIPPPSTAAAQRSQPTTEAPERISSSTAAPERCPPARENARGRKEKKRSAPTGTGEEASEKKQRKRRKKEKREMELNSSGGDGSETISEKKQRRSRKKEKRQLESESCMGSGGSEAEADEDMRETVAAATLPAVVSEDQSLATSLESDATATGKDADPASEVVRWQSFALETEDSDSAPIVESTSCVSRSEKKKRKKEKKKEKRQKKRKKEKDGRVGETQEERALRKFTKKFRKEEKKKRLELEAS